MLWRLCLPKQWYRLGLDGSPKELVPHISESLWSSNFLVLRPHLSLLACWHAWTEHMSMHFFSVATSLVVNTCNSAFSPVVPHLWRSLAVFSTEIAGVVGNWKPSSWRTHPSASMNTKDNAVMWLSKLHKNSPGYCLQTCPTHIAVLWYPRTDRPASSAELVPAVVANGCGVWAGLLILGYTADKVLPGLASSESVSLIDIDWQLSTLKSKLLCQQIITGNGRLACYCLFLLLIVGPLRVLMNEMCNSTWNHCMYISIKGSCREEFDFNTSLQTWSNLKHNYYFEYKHHWED